MARTNPQSPAVNVPEGELSVAKNASGAVAEVQAAVLMAKHFPRDYDKCWEALARACKRKELADRAEYNFPRGGKPVTGPSVYLAREGAKIYGNIQHGLNILAEDQTNVHISGWAWDLETNVRVSFEDRFKKLHWRKDKQGGGKWVTPDERDLRELINRRGAILVRNAILGILPTELIDNSRKLCQDTMKAGVSDPNAEKKNLVLWYQRYDISLEMLREYMGSSEWTVDDLIALKQIRNSIKDGFSQFSDYFDVGNGETTKSGNGSAKDKLKQKAADINGDGKPEESPKEQPAPGPEQSADNKSAAAKPSAEPPPEKKESTPPPGDTGFAEKLAIVQQLLETKEVPAPLRNKCEEWIKGSTQHTVSFAMSWIDSLGAFPDRGEGPPATGTSTEKSSGGSAGQPQGSLGF